MSSVTGTSKYWTGTEWVLADGSVTTPPGVGDTGVLGGSVSGLSLAQSGTVSFFGLVAVDIGTLEVDGTGPWIIEGTGGTGSTIDSLSVAVGATVTVDSTIAVKNVVVRQVTGVTTPATITLSDGLPPGAAIDAANETITYTSLYSIGYTNVAVSTASGTLANIAVAGNVQFAGPPASDGSGGTQVVVTGTQPDILSPDFVLDVRSTNDIGRKSGDFIKLDYQNVTPNGYQGTSISATATNGKVISLSFAASPALPDEFGSTLTYDPTNPADSYEISPWTVTVKNGTSTLAAATLSLVGVTPPPFASNVTISGNSANPTFTWSYPSGSIDGVFFDIYDDTAKNSAGGASFIYSATIPGNTGTYTVPSALAGGLTLQQGHHYTLDLYGVKTLNRLGKINASNSQAWSESYFDFVPTGGTTPQVYLPTITSSGAYQFHDTGIVAGQQIFIDPAIATGYTYATAAGDPNFASVLLPAVQTASYTVSFLDNGVQETDSVAPSTVFDFPTGGVSTFTVTGIDPADNLDPANATAFDTGLTFVADGSFNGTQTPIVSQTLCFCAGTLIATPSGEVPAERLAVGDKVLTVRGGVRPVTWIGVGQVLATRGRRTAATPVIVRKGALADNVPHQDLRVTKGHALYLEDALIPVEFLVNHRSILWDDRAQEVLLYHIELASHDVLLANGVPAESYRDDGNRWLFQNANSGWDLPPQDPCAPVLTGGPVVDAIWRRLLGRSGPRTALPLTDDPDLHLLVDGKRIDAIERRDEMRAFRLLVRPRSIRICSRAAVPQELGISRDARPLGVAVRRIVLAQPREQCAIDADATSLVDGYHAFEPDSGIRWTAGDAAVPAALFAGMNGPAMLILHLGGATQYLDEGTAVKVA